METALKIYMNLCLIYLIRISYIKLVFKTFIISIFLRIIRVLFLYGMSKYIYFIRHIINYKYILRSVFYEI